MSQFEVHSVQRVALNAAQSRRFGAAESLHNAETCNAPERATNQLPVNSTGKSNYNLAKFASMTLAERTKNHPGAAVAPGPVEHALV